MNLEQQRQREHRRILAGIVIVGAGLCFLSGIVLGMIDLWTVGETFTWGWHLAVQLTAGFGGMLLAGWYVDRQRKRR